MATKKNKLTDPCTGCKYLEKTDKGLVEYISYEYYCTFLNNPINIYGRCGEYSEN